jgi:integrase
MSAKSVRNVHGTLRKAIQDGVRARVLSWNPATAVDLPRWERPELDAYDGEEIGRLLAHVRTQGDPVVFALLRLLFATGMRRGEVLGLRWRDVDFVERTVRVRETRSVVNGRIVLGTPKTRSSARRYSLDADTVIALAAAKSSVDDVLSAAGATLSDDDFVCTQHDGRPFHPLALTRTFQRLAKAAGLRRIRLHDIRASAAQQQFALGIDPVTVSQRLGHSRVSTTLDVYGRFLPSHDQEAADTVGAALDRAMRQASDADSGRGMDAGLDGNAQSRRTTRDDEPRETALSTPKRSGTVEATSGIEPD